MEGAAAGQPRRARVAGASRPVGNSEGGYIRSITELNAPQGAAVDSRNHVWVVDTEDDQVNEYSSTGEYLGEIGSYGNGDGQLN